MGSFIGGRFQNLLPCSVITSMGVFQRDDLLRIFIIRLGMIFIIRLGRIFVIRLGRIFVIRLGRIFVIRLGRIFVIRLGRIFIICFSRIFIIRLGGLTDLVPKSCTVSFVFIIIRFCRQ